jgi:hypothetical protein
MLAHGGTGGLIVELAIVVGLLAVFGLAWLHGRKEKDEE